MREAFFADLTAPSRVVSTRAPLCPRLTRASLAGLLASAHAIAPPLVGSARAEPRPHAAPAEDAGFGPTEARRLAHVEQTLAADRESSLRWYLAWNGVFAASAGIRAGLWATSSHRDVVAESRVVGVLSVLGVLSTAPVPPAALFGDDDPGPDASPAAKRAYLERREGRLTKAAELERFGRAPISHFAGIVVNVVAGLYLWKQDGLPERGALAAATGIAAVEAKIWTQPTRALRTATPPPTLPWIVAVAPLGGTTPGFVVVGAF